MNPLLEVVDLRVEIATARGLVRPVDGVSFTVGAGETFALLGESGCGKSMTALSLLRLLPPGGRIGGGAVRFAGRDLLALPESEMRVVRGGGLAMIFQEPATSLNPVLTVGAQIGEVLIRHAGMAAAGAAKRGRDLLDAVGIPDAERRMKEFPFQLSGGMKQRVMIAMALAGEPKLLIADEPTTALDVTIQAQVLELLADLQRRRGMAMFLISHDLGIVATMADRVGVMYAGELVETGPGRAFFAAPRHPYAQKLFAALPAPGGRGRSLETIPGTVPPLTRAFRGCRFAERCPLVFDRCRSEAPGWSGVDAQRVRCHLYERDGTALIARPAAARVAAPAADGERLLEVADLKVHFPLRRGLLQRTVGYLRAVDGISLSLSPGRTLALVGESGCGKTTAGKAILRLLRPTGGSVRLAGEEIAALPVAALKAKRAMMQMVFQDPYGSLNPRLRVGTTIAEGMRALRVVASRGEGERRVGELLAAVGLDPDMAARYPHEFSGGQRQRIAIARALAVAPRLLICDEPTSALDVSVQAQILNLLRELQGRLGLAYLFITHNIAIVDYLADAVAVMYLGRIVETGSAAEVLGEPRHPYTVALIAAVPRMDPAAGVAAKAVGELPSPAAPPSGCHFHPRCPQAMARCRSEYPAETRLSPTRTVRC